MDAQYTNQPPKKVKSAKPVKKGWIVAGVVALLLLFVGFNAVVVVPAGHTGVVVTLGSVSEYVLQEGFHLKIPFVQEIVQMDNRIVKLEVQTEAFSKDLQTVSTSLAVNYRVDKSKSYSIYKNVGASYEDVLVAPAVNEVLKSIVSMYTAEESITTRAAISVSLLEELNVKLNEVGIYIEDINIIDFDFSDAYVSAIEAKQVAEQDLLRTKTEQEQQIVIAQAEAEKVRIAAEAQAQQRVIAAQAEAESITAIAQAKAQANQLLSESLTDDVIDYAAIEAWDGKLPSVTGGATPFVNIDDDRQASQQTSQQ